MPRARGIALFIVLVFLAILASIAAATVRSAWISERIARHALDRMLAFQAAEAALHDAERDLEGQRHDGAVCAAGTAGCRPAGQRPIQGAGAAGLSDFNAACGSAASRGQCARDAGHYFDPPVWRDAALVEAAATYGQYTAAPALAEVARQPHYWIEGFLKAHGYAFRITAVGYGALPATRVTLQAIYLMGEAP